ncbi:MAG: VWA domain-containing protein [Acidobacteriota bacterium]
MKFESGRLAFVAGVVITLSFLVAGFPSPSLAGAGQQRPDKPKLQKPQQPKDDESQQKPQQKDDAPIRIGTDLVLLDVTVVDPSNKPVMDLKREDFAVSEDKLAQKIEFFSRDQVPVSLVFTIDTSGSMRPKLDTVVKASTNLVKESRSGDEIAVIEFKDQPELLEEFSGDINDVIDTLNGLVASRQTAMLDALYLGADYANKEGKNRRKAVLVVTDGLDNDSYYKFGEVVSHLREIDVQIYLIGFISDLDRDSGLFKKSAKEKAETLLNKLAEETGGKAFFPRELSEVHAIAQQISTDLRTQYSIGYYPTNSKKDGSFRAVKVQVNGGTRRLVARTRNGYTAPREGEAHNNSK